MSKTIPILTITFIVWTKYCVRSAPIQGNITGSPWENMASEQRNLRPFQSFLVNKTILPFLSECYKGNCCVQQDQLFCPTYYEMVIRLNHSKQLENLTETELRDMQSVKDELNPDEVQKFCENFSKIIPELTLKWNASDIKKPLANPNPFYCITVCFTQRVSENQEVLFTKKPFCKMITWMANLTTNEPVPPQNNITANKDVVQSVSGNQFPLPVIKPEANVKEDQAAATTEKNKTKKPKTNPLTEEEKESDKIKIQDREEVITAKNPNATQAASNNTADKDLPSQSKPDTNVEKPQFPEKPVIEDEKPAIENEGSNPVLGSPEENAKDHNEIPLGKSPNDQGNDANGEIIQEDPEEGFGQDNPKSDPLLYSNEDDNGIDDVRSPQADTKQGPRDPALEKFIESNAQDITQKAGVGVSSNYIPASDPFYEEAGSNFFTYFLIGMFVCILLYVLYHNKTKVLALILEGRRSQKGRGGRRKHTAQYRKLDTNLEEAITSSTSARSSQIIY